jgi:hypothetical protein
MRRRVCRTFQRTRFKSAPSRQADERVARSTTRSLVTRIFQTATFPLRLPCRAKMLTTSWLRFESPGETGLAPPQASRTGVLVALEQVTSTRPANSSSSLASTTIRSLVGTTSAFCSSTSAAQETRTRTVLRSQVARCTTGLTTALRSEASFTLLPWHTNREREATHSLSRVFLQGPLSVASNNDSHTIAAAVIARQRLVRNNK